MQSDAVKRHTSPTRLQASGDPPATPALPIPDRTAMRASSHIEDLTHDPGGLNKRLDATVAASLTGLRETVRKIYAFIEGRW